MTDKEPTHLPLGCSIRNLVKVRGILFFIKGSTCAPIRNLALNWKVKRIQRDKDNMPVKNYMYLTR